jgi:glycosyltransferase involved in cell wall biosynthesis
MNFLEQLRFNRKAASIVQKLNPEYIHCHDLLTLPAGVWAKRKARIVFDAHELMPESMGGIKKKVWGYIEKSYIKSCDFILMPERNRIAYFKKKYRQIPEPLLLENFPRKSDIPSQRYNLFREVYNISEEQKIVLYSGNVGPGRQLEELIESMTFCGNEFVLVVLGRAFKGYEQTLQGKVEKLGLTRRVFFHPAVPHSDILRYMASCDIGTSFYRNTNLNNFYCASNKLYEYIALNKVVLTNNYPGLLNAVECLRQGICLPEVNPLSLVKAYERSIHDENVTPGIHKYFWEEQEHILFRLYSQ